MGFNFDEKDLEKAGESKSFNDGKAGRVMDVKVSVEKLGKEFQSESPNAPQYRIIFQDSEGRMTNRACFSIKESDYPKPWGGDYTADIKKEWAFLAKIAEHTGGVKPMDFENDTDLYEKMYTTGVGTDKINVFANYGTKSSPKDRLEVRKWLPAVEPAGTSDEDTKLRATGIEQMSVIIPDETESQDSFFE